jgi:acyl-lipid omega-6 desaturase (Delta-12 desaturase)
MITERNTSLEVTAPTVPVIPAAKPGSKNYWQKLVAPYAHSDLRYSLGQLANSLLPYLALWGLMIWSLHISYLITLVLVIPASGFLMRLFIIFHDCGHGSFFKSTTANRWVGFFLGVLAFTPSENWWHDHAIHHATTGNLDKRGVGDVMTMTVEEYVQSSPWKRLTYRLFRHPLIMFIFGPILVFFIMDRIPSPTAGKRERRSVIFANLTLLAIFLIASFTIGWKAYLLIQIPVMWLAGAIGLWLFYIQHQFEEVYWVRNDQWDFTHAALDGASFYKLPRIIQWFSGNIGYHHIHHLMPRIPNYFLEKCYNENPDLQCPATFNLGNSLKSLKLRLWDEQAHRMVGFKGAKLHRVRQQPG